MRRHRSLHAKAPCPGRGPRLGAAWRNAAIDDIANRGRREWKQASGYHKRSLVENLMYRLKRLTGDCLWARTIGSQATEVAIRAGVLNRMAALARPQSVRVI